MIKHPVAQDGLGPTLLVPPVQQVVIRQALPVRTLHKVPYQEVHSIGGKHQQRILMGLMPLPTQVPVTPLLQQVVARQRQVWINY